MARFVQQRNVDDRERRQVEQLEGAKTGRDGAIDRGVNQCLQIVARRRVGKHNGAELGAVDTAVSGQDVGAKPSRNGRGRFGTTRRHAMRERIGIEARHAAPAELLEHVGLAGGDPAGEGNSQHPVHVIHWRRGPNRHPLAAAALGTPPPWRELTPMPRAIPLVPSRSRP